MIGYGRVGTVRIPFTCINDVNGYVHKTTSNDHRAMIIIMLLIDHCVEHGQLFTLDY